MVTSSELPAFGSFYEAVKDRVFQAVLASGRNPTRAEDAVSDAFAKAFERWDQVGRMPNATAWVVRVAINQYNSDWRIWRRELPKPPAVEVSHAEQRPDDGLVELVWHLPRRQREVVAMRILADLSEIETAEVLGISPKTVSVHLHRAISQLRAGLAASRNKDETWTTQTSPVK